MKSRKLLIAVAFCAATALWNSAVYSQAKEEKKPEAAKPALATPPAAKPADKPAAATPPAAGKPAGDKTAGGDDEMMKKLMELSTPGKEHEALKPLIGSWTCAVKLWMVPGTPPQESTGTMERKWILGGRYLQEDYKGTAMGMPFEGMGLLGYDKAQKRYESSWMDTMSTTTMKMTGSADASGKTFTFTGENFDCMEGKPVKSRSTMEIVNNDKQVMKMFAPGPDGKEFLTFEMVVTRK